jgi:poly(3-hydroxyoctanoate) depolymerase
LTISLDAPTTTEHVRVKGLDVAVQVRGAGQPLLLLSGIWGELPLWEPLHPYLDGFQTIAFDPPGVGGTECPPAPMTMRGLAGFTASVLDELGIERADVLGGSFGGAVAQQLAFSHRRRVRRLVLVSTSFGGFAVPGSPIAFYHFARPSAYTPERLLETAGKMFGGRFRTEPHLVTSLHFERPSSLRAIMYRMFPLWGWTSLPWLPAIRQPTFLVCGDDDPVTPMVNHWLMARLIPNSCLFVVPNGGHLVLLDSAEKVVPEIVAFLRSGAP